MRRWYEEYPDRLDAELAALNEGSFAFIRDEEHQRRTGQILLRGTYTRPGGAELELEIVYPDSFPYLRPEVFAPALRLPRHQHRYRGNLCLLDPSTRHWDPSLTAARLVREQLEKLLTLIESGDPDAMAAAETPQGEPATRYFAGDVGSVVFLPREILAGANGQASGTMQLAVGNPETGADLLRACVSRIQQNDGSVLADVASPLAERFGRTIMNGTWVRLPELPAGAGTPADLLSAARSTPGYRQPPWNPIQRGRARVVGVVTREEVRQGEEDDGWLFVVEVERNNRAQEPFIARGDRLTPEDMQERIPSLRGMAEKRVAVAGLGALGAPIAIELARAQTGELHVLDHDRVETGTAVRWPWGISAAGHSKVAVIRDVLSANWPFTRVKVFPHRIGVTVGRTDDDRPAEHEVLTGFLEGAHLLVEATGEVGVQYLLSRLAHEAGIPQVYASSTPGGWGGLVVRVLPGTTGCWYCLQLRLEDGTIEPPPFAEDGRAQPRGCMTPTWTGSSFDALPVIAQAARVASGTLLQGRIGDDPRDVFVLSQPGEGNLHAAPTWQAYPLESHSRCFFCAGGDGR